MDKEKKYPEKRDIRAIAIILATQAMIHLGEIADPLGGHKTVTFAGARFFVDLLAELRVKLLKDYKPDGFNIGINDGTAAGQTVMHLHIHLIPRYTGDIPDPRGGVRWIFPDKATYWK